MPRRAFVAALPALLRPVAALGFSALLAACSGPGGLASAPVPPARPAGLGATPEPSAESVAMRAHFAGVQANLLAQGLLRTDAGGPDTPFNERQLAENFIRIALYDEYVLRAGVYVSQPTPSRLRRWEQPVRMTVEFGASVPAAQRARDSADISAYAARLSRISGLPIRMSGQNANFHVLVLNEDERRNYADRLNQIIPGIDRSTLAAITGMSPSTYCVVYAFSNGSSPIYSEAVAVIRGEHPDLLRLSCIHEELAQGLGLANDSPAARPSIFNDDEEFALLTRQDELMLKMLYDRRLTPGMTPDQARPIVETIATELVGGAS